MIERRESQRSKSLPLSSMSKITEVKGCIIEKARCTKRRMKVRKIAPSLRGVAEAAGLIGAGKLVFIPTETVYIACTAIQPSPFLSPNTPFMNLLPTRRTNETIIEPPLLLLMSKPVSTLRRLACWKQKRPYAIQQKDVATSESSPVVFFSEAEEVLRRLAMKFWPGPMIIYANTENKSLLPLASKKDNSNYVAISSPSHPLAKRILREGYSSMKLGDTNRVLVGSLSCGGSSSTTTNGSYYLTKASDVSRRVASKFAYSSEDNNKHVAHVIDGEETRELFSVPTCQYGQPCPSSLWIDEPSRTLYIRGKDTFGDIAKDMSEDSLKKLLLLASQCNTTYENQTYTDKVVSAVLFKWKVVDERPK